MLCLIHSHYFSHSLIHLLKSFSGQLQEWSGISYEVTAQVFLIRFMLYSLISSSFLVLLIYPFLSFSFISTWLMLSASKMRNCLYVTFPPTVLILSGFCCFIPSVRCRLPLFITSNAYFSMPNSIVMSWLYILIVCIRVSTSFSSFRTVRCHPCTLGDWFFLAIF